ncbi:TROVE domain-containing protein [Dyadobacter sp. SG02]|uniref:TROVE domain-containing protein n=1 Tax=Dyadobacter sp. SG02 TaxID=1855291 RepID=UPI0008B37D7A|nr:TROVE domain-containing protein [Dyadobacter sp. SG02]SEJ80086.1 TROVE domain-containing protein [Dyadobacter sp. SG02]
MKFNTQVAKVNEVQNYEGAKAYLLDPAMELYTAVVTWSLNDSFYEKNDQRLIRVRALVEKVEPEFVAKLAVYARHFMYMRSVPLVLLTELARVHKGDDLVAKATEKVIARADEITELLACYQLLNERKGMKKLNALSKQLQKGLAAAFNKFDAYQFGKYNRDSSAVKLRDALFLVHPKAKDAAQQAVFDKIATNQLETPYTWETELSALGQQLFTDETQRAEAFRAKWEELIDSGRLGYMALLRNLRNLLEMNVSAAHIGKVCEVLSSQKEVLKAKQFPFRYLSAYRELLKMKLPKGKVSHKIMKLFGSEPDGRERLINALEAAIVQSAAGISGFGKETRVLLACDVSGSMQTPVSAKSSVMLYDVGLVLAMLLQNRCANVEVGMFGDTWKRIRVAKTNILANVQEFYKREGEVGYATNGYLVIKDLLHRKVVMDKVMLFTDGQFWDSSGTESIQDLWVRYKRELAPEAKLYLFDLQGYRQAPLRIMHNDVYLIAGWSDKIFGVLNALENGSNTLEIINKQVI